MTVEPLLTTVACMECFRPWGAILGRGFEPELKYETEARAMMLDELIEDMDDDTETADLSRVEALELKRVVYISEAEGDFAHDHLNCEAFIEGAWQEIDWVDLPGWFLKGRKQRWAYRWDCCNLDYDIKPKEDE